MKKHELYLYNTLTRKKELFKPIVSGEVGFYSCGPTVYWNQHIGNLRTYVFNDILKRVLLYDGYKVKHIMNVTDVGHLTSDADTGEDKMEKAAAKEGKKAQDIADYYWKIFRQDFRKLNIIEPDVWCKATEYIQEQINMLKVLEKKGFTYKTSDGIYFDSLKLNDYGKLAKLKIEGLKAGIRTDVREKKNPTDFALWKFSEKPGIRQQEWNSPWGIGFPGWHLECSAMAAKHLGKQFDIHTGGEDHITVHHTNEIAQAEAAFGKKPWVKYWLHGAFLTSKGEKISKSKGGLFTIDNLEEKRFKPLSYRYLCLNTHYRKQLSFSLEVLKNAEKSYDRLRTIIRDLKQEKDKSKTEQNTNKQEINELYLTKFEDAINDDLNMPQALAVLWDFVRDKDAKGKLKTIEEMEKVFALDLLVEEEKVKVSDKITKLIDEREQARKDKDFAKADKIRDKLKEKGIILEDTKDGVRWKKV